MALVAGCAEGTVRTLAAAAIAAVALGCAAAPVHAAPTDPGLEKLWKEFPLDEQPAAPVLRGEPAGDRAEDVPPPAVRRSTQPAAPETAAPSEDDMSRPLLVLITVALLLVLAASALALPLFGVVTAPRQGRRTLAVRPLVTSVRSRERAPRRATLALADGRDEVRPDQSAHAARRSTSRTVDDLLRATRPQLTRTKKRGVRMDMARATTNAADEPTTRELREDAKAGRALKTNPGAWMLKQAADQQAKRERLEDAKAGLALKADPDALKLKQAADEQAKSERREDAKGGLALKPDPDALKLKGERLLATDPLKLSPPEAPEGRPLEALKEKLATPPGDDDVEALKRSGTGHGARRRLTRGNRRPALRSLVDPVETSRQHHALRDTTQALECEIKRWRGYVTSQFYAVATAADGTETIIRNSPSFRWRRSDLPETPGAAAALGTLVRSLQQEGWRVEDRGDEWFSVRLRQTQVGPSAGAAGAHQ